MNKDEIKKVLLELLEEDEMVINKLKNKFRKLIDKYIQSLESKQLDSKSLQGGEFMGNDPLNKEIKRLKAEIRELERINKNKDNEIIKLKEFKAQFEKSVNLFNKYKNLSEDTLYSLENVFLIRDFSSFLYCGVQYDNIEALWDFIKSEINRNKSNKDIKVLKEIFYYFFDAHNKIYDSPKYELLKYETEIGDNFDDDFHIRGNNSKPSGEIREILLYGYKIINNDRVMKKSVVII